MGPRLAVAVVAATLSFPAVAVAASLPPKDVGPPLLHRAAPDVPELQNTRPWRAAPLLVSGTDAIRAGEYVFQDHLVDDRGADTLPLGNLARTDKANPTSTGDIAASTGGDVRYPTAAKYAGNAADLAEVRLRPVERGVMVRMTFRTAVDPGAVVATLGLDLDRSGGAEVAWPRGAGLTSPGVDVFATVWGTGGELQRTGGATEPLTTRFDLERNQLTFTVPVEPGRWRAVAGAGLWDGDSYLPVPAGQAATEDRPASGNPLRSAPAVLDLAFSFAEPIEKFPTGEFTTFPGTGNWLEERQAKTLASGSTGALAADIDLTALDRPRWLHAPGRVQARVLGSGLKTHEGVRTTFPEIGSRLVPYLLVRPDGLGTEAAPAGLTLALHSFGGTYTQHAVFSPNMLRQLGDERRSVVVTPSSRSLGGGYADEAEADVFEVWADVARHVTLDPRRTAITGYSMGGFGTYRLANAYPDLFGAAFTGVGPAGSSAPGTETNVRWVPFLNWVAVADELVTYDRARAAHQRMVDAGMRSALWSFAGEHFTLAILDEWAGARDFLGDATPVRDPGRVTYAADPAAARTDLGLSRDGAYWVVRLRPRDVKARVRADARALGRGLGDAPAVDLLGTSGLTGGPGPALLVEGRGWGPVPRPAPRRRLELDLANVAAARVDLRRAGFEGRTPVEVVVTSDGPARLLVRGRRGCDVTAGTTTCRLAP